MPLQQRIVTIEQGAMVLTGNTLNIREATPYPPAGIDHLNGSYTSTDTSLVAAAGFPNGTTFLAPASSSAAVLNMPAGSTVIYAQLSWMLFNSSPSPDANIDFVLPTGVTVNISPNLALKQTNGNVSWQAQDVTAIVDAAGSGTYIVANVPGNPITDGATISSNAWWLMVLYRNQNLPYRYFNINTGLADVSPGSPSDFNFAGFYTPSAGAVKGYLLVGESNGDLIDAAQIYIGPNLAGAVKVGNPSVGVWNNVAPYAQIDNMLPGNILIGDTNDPNIGLLDTRGSFGTYNRNPFAGTAPPFARNNCDILGLDISSQLTNNQNTLFTRVTDVIGGGGLVNQSVQVDLQSANLGNITKTVNKNFAVVGDTLTYTVRIENTGLATANNVVFMDTIPSNTTLVGSSVKINGVTSLTANPALPGINLSSMGNGQVNTIDFTVVVASTNPSYVLDNKSQVTYNYLLATGFPAQFAEATSNIATSTIVYAELSASKSVDKATAYPGDILTYSIPITNSGTTLARNLVFIDTISSNATFVANSIKQDNVTVSGSPAPPGVLLSNIPGNTVSTVTFQVQVNVSPSTNTIPNSSLMTYSYTANPTSGLTINSSTVTNTVTTTITDANLSSITKTVNKTWTDINTTLNYTIAMSNTGISTATNVILIDTIPRGTVFLPGSVRIDGVTSISANPQPPGINLGNIGPNIRTTVNFIVTVSPTIPYPASLPNVAQILYNVGTSVTQALSNNVVTTLSSAVIVTSKSVDKTATNLTDVLTYTIPITNIGTATATGIIFVDTIPSSLTVVPSSFKQDGTTLLTLPNPPGVPLVNIAPGATSTITFKATVTTIPLSGSIENSATVNYSYIVDPITVPIIQVTTSTNTNVVTSSVSAADLSDITKSVNKNYTEINTTLQYTIVFNNAGNASANNVIFMDTIPSGSTFIAGSVFINGSNNPAANPALPGINLGTIGPLTRTTITFNVTAAPTMPYPTTIVNTSQITYNYSASGGNPVFTQATSNSVTTTISTAIISPSKQVDRSYATIGNVITYTLPLVNSGTTIARNVVFVDTIPTGLSLVAGSLKQDNIVIVGDPNPPGVNLNNISPNTTSTVTFQLTVVSLPNPASIVNIGSFSYSYTVDPSTTPVIQVTTTTSANSTPTTVSAAILSTMSKSADSYYARCGDTLTFTITLPNTGNATAINVIFSDSIPPGTTFVADSVIVNGSPRLGVTPSPPAGINVGNISPGSSAVIKFKVNVTC